MNVEEEQQREYYKYFFLHIAYVYQEIKNTTMRYITGQNKKEGDPLDFYRSRPYKVLP